MGAEGYTKKSFVLFVHEVVNNILQKAEFFNNPSHRVFFPSIFYPSMNDLPSH